MAASNPVDANTPPVTPQKSSQSQSHISNHQSDSPVPMPMSSHASSSLVDPIDTINDIVESTGAPVKAQFFRMKKRKIVATEKREASSPFQCQCQCTLNIAKRHRASASSSMSPSPPPPPSPVRPVQLDPHRLWVVQEINWDPVAGVWAVPESPSPLLMSPPSSRKAPSLKSLSVLSLSPLSPVNLNSDKFDECVIRAGDDEMKAELGSDENTQSPKSPNSKRVSTSSVASSFTCWTSSESRSVTMTLGSQDTPSPSYDDSLSDV